MVEHAFNPSTQEAEACRFLNSRQPGLQSKFQDSQGYTEKPCLREREREREKQRGGGGRSLVTHAFNSSTGEAEAVRSLNSRPAWSTE
jgi:hypothetical protein